MADRLIIEVDADEVLAMLEQLGETAEQLVHDASRVTAERIQEEARGRARRRTGRLIEAIRIEEADPPLGGFRVYVDKMSDPEGGSRPQEFPLWHEFGTKDMTAQPFLFNSAKLEEGPHFRRIVEAIEQAIEEENS